MGEFRPLAPGFLPKGIIGPKRAHKLQYGRELQDNVKIILVIGPVGAGKTSLVKLLTGEDLRPGHMLDDGTALPTYVPAAIDGRPYIFIDSPGFGHSAAQPGVIKKQIQAALGFFTRALGGIHGILYGQDIMVERSLPGMQEAIDFLDELAGRAIRPHITFITTKWDIPESVPKLMRKCVNRETELKTKTWAKFRVSEQGGSRYFRHGVDCDEDSQQDQEHAKNLLTSSVMARYKTVSAKALIMPFSEWADEYVDEELKIATTTGQVILVGAGLGFVGLIVALIAGVPVSVSFGLAFAL
ncbi:P-loop containing nucleoside triphosphate hydrolase protein [Trichoderma pleuroticola]